MNVKLFLTIESNGVAQQLDVSKLDLKTLEPKLREDIVLEINALVRKIDGEHIYSLMNSEIESSEVSYRNFGGGDPIRKLILVIKDVCDQILNLL